jgi:hypothetical protein
MMLHSGRVTGNIDDPAISLEMLRQMRMLNLYRKSGGTEASHPSGIAEGGFIDAILRQVFPPKNPKRSSARQSRHHEGPGQGRPRVCGIQVIVADGIAHLAL